MIIVADSQRRVRLPKPAHPGDAFALEASPEGRFILTRLRKPAKKLRFLRQQGFLVASTGRQITMGETRVLLDEFP